MTCRLDHPLKPDDSGKDDPAEVKIFVHWEFVKIYTAPGIMKKQ